MNESVAWFSERYRKLAERRVLEAGTLRWGDLPTHHEAELWPYDKYVRTDIKLGTDVDIAIDLHDLRNSVQPGEFNVFWASSVWEHLHSPWECAEQVIEILPKGGLFFIQTHLVFPEHGYPSDYFRFTTMALERIFKGASEVKSCYEFEGRIVPKDPKSYLNLEAVCHLNSCIAGMK